MGRWGTGNFESDEALDFMWLAVQKPLQDRISANLSGQREQGPAATDVMAALGILTALVERCNAAPPEPDELEGWRTAMLERFDLESLELAESGASADFLEGHRAEIVRSFDALLERSRAFYAKS